METLKQFLKDIYNITAESISPIGAGLVNTNYYVKSLAGEYLIKRYNQKPANQVRFETDFLQTLASSPIPSPRLVPSLNGDVLTVFEDKPYIVYDYISGQPLTNCTVVILKQIGALMAEMHLALNNFEPKVAKPGWEIADLKKLVIDSGGSLNKRGHAHADELISFVSAELEQFDFPANLPAGMTHQDIKPENILVHEGRISGIVDFDNSYYGTLLDDLTTAIIWMCFEKQKLVQSRVDALLAGYESVRPLAAVEHECLHERIRFRLLREVFIGPYAATNPNDAQERSEYFKEMYQQFVPNTRNSNYTAIILAAGKGTRLGFLTQETAKPLLSVGEMSLLEHALLFVRSLGVAKTIVVARYQYDKLVAAVSDYNQQYNDQVLVVKVGYGTLNSFVGALPEVLDGNILVRDSDYIFSKNTLEAVEKNLGGTGIFCSYDVSGDSVDVMKVKTDGQGRLAASSKILTDFDALYAGIFTLATEDMPVARAIIDEQFSQHPKEEPRVEVLFTELRARGKAVAVKDVGPADWLEIDTPEELTAARLAFNSNYQI